MAPNSVVLIGWEAGDPSRPYAVPAWESGASVNRLTFNAGALELAGNTYSLPQWDAFMTDLNTFMATVKLANPTLAGLAAIQSAGNVFAGQIAIANSYKSLKVKNG